VTKFIHNLPHKEKDPLPLPFGSGSWDLDGKERVGRVNFSF